MDFDKMNGLVPAIIQDADTAKVLMLGLVLHFENTLYYESRVLYDIAKPMILIL